MINYNKKCSVCNQIRKTPRLADDIYKTTAYDRTSKVSLQKLQQVYAGVFSYQSLTNHVKKHQGLSAEDLSQRHLKNIVATAEKELVKKNIESRDIWGTVLNMGGEQIQSGEIKLRAGDVLRAAKDKSDHELKVKDQELAMIEMVYHFASGESKSNDMIGLKREDTSRRPIDAETIPEGEVLDTTQESTGDFGVGENGPSSVYYPPAWDAAS